MRFQIRHRNPGKSRGAQHVLFADREEAQVALQTMSPGDLVNWEIVAVEFKPRSRA